MNWRVWLLVALLGAAVVAGAFLLPRGGELDSALARAARRTLDSPGYRLTVSGPDGRTGHEDYAAPDRVRITSSLDADESEFTAIGNTIYGPASCTTSSGTVTGHSEHHLQGGARTLGTGTGVLLEAEHARSATRDRAGRYEFTFRLAVPERLRNRVHLAPVRVEARVEDGRVRSFVVHFRQGHRSTTTRGTFAFGQVPEIEAPKGPPLDTSHCTIGFEAG